MATERNFKFACTPEVSFCELYAVLIENAKMWHFVEVEEEDGSVRYNGDFSLQSQIDVARFQVKFDGERWGIMKSEPFNYSNPLPHAFTHTKYDNSEMRKDSKWNDIAYDVTHDVITLRPWQRAVVYVFRKRERPERYIHLIESRTASGITYLMHYLESEPYNVDCREILEVADIKNLMFGCVGYVIRISPTITGDDLRFVMAYIEKVKRGSRGVVPVVWIFTHDMQMTHKAIREITKYKSHYM